MRMKCPSMIPIHGGLRPVPRNSKGGAPEKNILLGEACAAPNLTAHPLIHPSAWKVNSANFGLLLTVAVMFADGSLVRLVGPDMRVRKGRRALHSLLVHP